MGMKCERCGSESKEVLEVIIPQERGEDGNMVYSWSHLCSDCILDLSNAIAKWWDDLPI